MRLFVAVRLPDTACAPIEDALRGRPEPLRWQPRERWHVTLAFLGEVDERLLPDLRERLDRAARRHAPIDGVRVHGAGTFGQRVLWAGLDVPDRGSLGRLAESVRAACRRTGVPLDDRPFRPHITLARLRPAESDPAPIASALGSLEGPPWTIDRIALVESRLHPAPAYVDVHISRLGR